MKDGVKIVSKITCKGGVIYMSNHESVNSEFHGLVNLVVNGAVACAPVAYLVGLFGPLSVNNWSSAGYFVLVGLVVSLVALVNVVKAGLAGSWKASSWSDHLWQRVVSAVALAASGWVLVWLAANFHPHVGF